VSVGGGGRSEGFRALETEEAAASLVSQVAAFVRDTDARIDGLDLDNEAIRSQVDLQHFLRFLRLLRLELPRPFELSAAIHVGQEQLLVPLLAPKVDFINLMAYDLPPTAPGKTNGLPNLGHSSLAAVSVILRKLAAAKAPMHQIRLGVPLYFRSLSSPQESKTWSELVDAKYVEAGSDTTTSGPGLWAGNGVDTVRAKVRLAKKYHLGGVFVWEMGQDTAPDHPMSLISAMGAELHHHDTLEDVKDEL
jgi:GH18 family chitinase